MHLGIRFECMLKAERNPLLARKRDYCRLLSQEGIMIKCLGNILDVRLQVMLHYDEYGGCTKENIEKIAMI